MFLVVILDFCIRYDYGRIRSIAVRKHHELHIHGIVVFRNVVGHHQRIHYIALTEQRIVFVVNLFGIDCILQIFPYHLCLA